jgi:hypothetical protein
MTPPETLLLFIVLVLVAMLYFLPTIIAFKRCHPQGLPIFLLNFLLGFTALGWVGALVWACMTWRKPLPEAPPAGRPILQDHRSLHWHWGTDLQPPPARQYPFHTPHPRDMARDTAQMPIPRRRYLVLP